MPHCLYGPCGGSSWRWPPRGRPLCGPCRLSGCGLFAGSFLDGLPVGFEVGLLVGTGVVARSCGRRQPVSVVAAGYVLSSRRTLSEPELRVELRLRREVGFGGPLACPGHRRPLLGVLLLVIIIILGREIVFAREGELLPGRAVFVDGFDDDRGTEASAARDRRRCLGGTAAPAARSLVVVEVGRVGDGRGSGGTAAPAACDLIVVDACVVRLLFEGLGLTSALDGRGCLRSRGRIPPRLCRLHRRFRRRSWDGGVQRSRSPEVPWRDGGTRRS